jgi:hypothetical protein
MAKKVLDRQIVGLPTGWVWSTEPWVNSRGKQSTARHGQWVGDGRRVKKANRSLSLREVQKRQGQEKAKQGIVKPAPVRRVGLIKTLRGHPESPQSKFKKEEHGDVKVLSFYNIVEARNYVALHGIDEKYLHVLIQVRYTEKIVDTSKTGSGTSVGKKNGYATLSSFRSAEVYNVGASSTEPKIRGLDNPWVQAETNIQNYDMSGKRARVFIYVAEK